MAVTPLHVFGWAKEVVLQPILEAIVEEPLTKTARRYDTVDFEGATCCVELKCRNAYDKNGRSVTSESHDTWLMPASKIDYAEANDKKVYLFYYFDGDKTLWMIEYNKGMFSHLESVRPIWHSQRSLHYYVPKEMWTLLDVEYGVVVE
jgi:hypothetical protein